MKTLKLTAKQIRDLSEAVDYAAEMVAVGRDECQEGSKEFKTYEATLERYYNLLDLLE